MSLRDCPSSVLCYLRLSLSRLPCWLAFLQHLHPLIRSCFRILARHPRFPALFLRRWLVFLQCLRSQLYLLVELVIPSPAACRLAVYLRVLLSAVRFLPLVTHWLLIFLFLFVLQLLQSLVLMFVLPVTGFSWAPKHLQDFRPSVPLFPRPVKLPLRFVVLHFAFVWPTRLWNRNRKIPLRHPKTGQS